MRCGRHWFPSLNVVIRENFVEDVGGDGIVPWATDGVLVEHNIARNCNRRAKRTMPASGRGARTIRSFN